MGVDVQWDNPEKTVLCFVYEGEWTWEEFYNIIKTGNGMMDSVPHRVISIVDMRKSDYMPPGAFVHIKRVVELSQDHNNTNISIFVDAERFMKILLDTARKMYKTVEINASFHFVNDIESARELAAKLIAESKNA